MYGSLHTNKTGGLDCSKLKNELYLCKQLQGFLCETSVLANEFCFPPPESVHHGLWNIIYFDCFHFSRMAIFKVEGVTISREVVLQQVEVL